MRQLAPLRTLRAAAPAGRPTHGLAKARAVRGADQRWLAAEGSLTVHLRTARPPLSVRVLAQGLRPCNAGDAKALGLRAGAAVHARTVLLIGAGQPMVFAHSVTPAAAAARGPWKALRGLAQRPLAELLFTRGDVQRSPLSQHWLPAAHPVARALCRAWSEATGQPCPARGVWQRWSTFHRHGQALLVGEYFVPGLMAGWPARRAQRALRYHRAD
ncbi:MAG TPA: chorismate lyase [Ideonella sp.]|uniref:chorismate--pyruvate lyase family protein n=1 Tax=Ideonella sp. TaxID=1929293 RepID=UPI002CB3375A|nr:chorismate lyase [Ideonella sp.]HSI51532.1 chorismate lyase [Ideonella sp.]